MTGIVVVTGPPGVDVSDVGAALAERLGRAQISVAGLQDELALEAEDTPRVWLRLDAERELKRRIELFEAAVVIDVHLGEPADVERLVAVLRPWWAGLVEIRCRVDGFDAPTLDAPRTLVLDGTTPPSVADLAAVVRDETPRPRRRRHR